LAELDRDADLFLGASIFHCVQFGREEGGDHPIWPVIPRNLVLEKLSSSDVPRSAASSPPTT
jgi:hypothetical protein